MVSYKVKLWLRLDDLRSHFVPVGIKGTFWALIDLSLFAISPNLHCPRVFRSLHLFLFLWLTVIDHSLHIWSTLLFHFWIRTDWNFLKIINGIISLFHNMITLWPIFVYNLKKYGQFRGKYRGGGIKSLIFGLKMNYSQKSQNQI